MREELTAEGRDRRWSSRKQPPGRPSSSNLSPELNPTQSRHASEQHDRRSETRTSRLCPFSWSLGGNDAKLLTSSPCCSCAVRPPDAPPPASTGTSYASADHTTLISLRLTIIKHENAS